MIKNCKVIGINRFKTSKGIVASVLFVDVTSCIPEGVDGFGSYVSNFIVWKNIPNGVVGKDFPVSVDRFGKVLDIEI